MMLVAIGLLVAAAAAYWFVLRRPRGARHEPRAASPLRRFGGVEIRLHAGACDAARALAGQRFLAKAAPALPLPQCSAAKCTCSFAKLADRRTDDRRFEHGGLGASLFNDGNRRARGDRRAAEEPRRHE